MPLLVDFPSKHHCVSYKLEQYCSVDLNVLATWGTSRPSPLLAEDVYAVIISPQHIAA